ncbi:MAG: PspA/IM30 family protein [Ancrocorticia sp.]|uniref:PspA/IM30 family protein n=1 Tax=Ancrocorticia sp. TaxID=2593684 RepID=UPI003F8F0A5E
MSEKQTILGRISQLAKANVNSLLDRAEDPQKMLDQMVRDYTNSIAEATDAVAVTVGNLRLAQADYNEDVETAKQWGQKALAASQRADAFRAEGNDSEAARFDNLAKVAITNQINSEQEARDAEPMITSQEEVVEKLKTGLEQMKGKLTELKTKRDQLVAREKSAGAQNQVQDAISSINVMDPTSELGRYEERVRRQEALAMGKAEVAASSLEDQFAELEDHSNDVEIETRLAALKAGADAAPDEQAQIEGKDFTSY